MAAVISASVMSLLTVGLLASADSAGNVLPSNCMEENIFCGWEVKVKIGTPRVFAITEQGEKGYCLEADSSSFSIQRSVTLTPAQSARLSFRWQVKTLPPGADFRSNLDDQAAQLLVLFEGSLPATAINYIWDTSAPVGTTGDYSIPFIIKVKTVVVSEGSEELGVWVSHERNLRADYERLFEEPFPGVRGVRFQINSQYTKSRAVGCISRIEFVEE